MTEKLSDEWIISENLKRIRENIEAACARVDRNPEEVCLLAVTKTVEPARINMALQLGVHHIGENRVQEFLQKREDLLLDGVGVHLIGHLQTNKASRIVGLVDMIESIDTIRVAQTVDELSRACGRVTDVLVEVNVGNEESKSGVTPENLVSFLWGISSLSGIRVRGLMAIPPISTTELQKRKYFSQIKQLFIDIQSKNIDNVHMEELSMGMSADYTEAILEGATIIRLGTALFGRRSL